MAAIIVPIQLWLAVPGWRDLGRRTDDQVRGKKSFLRPFVFINPRNSMAYWLLGRR